MFFFSLLIVGDRYSIEGLKTYASYTISMTLDTTNVVDIYVDAVTKLPIIGKASGLKHHLTFHKRMIQFQNKHGPSLGF